MGSKVCPTSIIPKSYAKYSKPGRLWRVSSQLKQASQRKAQAARLYILKYPTVGSRIDRVTG